MSHVNQTTMELRSDREVIIRRTFDAPARLVFEAWTRPELVARWWAPRSHGVEVASAEAEVRAGGRYRYVLRRVGGGDEIAFSGTYRDVDPPGRLVYTQVFEPMADGGAAVVTITFTERGGSTDLVAHEVYPSAEARDAAIGAGMEHGMRETLEQLEALLATLA